MKRRGFTLIEIIIVIAILLVIAAIAIFSSSGVIRNYEINRVSRGLASILERARSLSVYSSDGSKHGVYLAKNEATLFVGQNYSPTESSNQVYRFGNMVELATTSLAISTSTIVFDRITGRTANYGSILLWIPSSTNSSSTLIVGKTGIIEVR